MTTGRTSAHRGRSGKSPLHGEPIHNRDVMRTTEAQHIRDLETRRQEQIAARATITRQIGDPTARAEILNQLGIA